MIFEPFFTTRSNGTGLGLAILRSIIEAHQGHVSYRPGLGGGAAFDVEIPVAIRPTEAGEHSRLPGENNGDT